MLNVTEDKSIVAVRKNEVKSSDFAYISAIHGYGMIELHYYYVFYNYKKSDYRNMIENNNLDSKIETISLFRNNKDQVIAIVESERSLLYEVAKEDLEGELHIGVDRIVYISKE